ncbi:MAG TPA: UxaA family hydrolase [Terriglobales bacterium]|nr:UxaA family hydrolase [Terriglobales bacterium]
MSVMFNGYLRPDGKVGVRNNVICIGTSSCVNAIVNQIARAVPGVIPLRHKEGCGDGQKSPHFRAMLTNLCKNPNHYAVILVGLGCEACSTVEIAQSIAADGKPVCCVEVHKVGGRAKALEIACEAGWRFVVEAATMKRTEQPISSLCLGTECGGSDALSGVTANPAQGYVSDWLIANGGTSLLTETSELVGCEQILADRAVSPEVARDIWRRISANTDLANQVAGIFGKQAAGVGKGNVGQVSAGVAQGNMKGGLSSIQEKSLGCVTKGGTSPVSGIFGFGELVGDRKGLQILDGVNSDLESVVGLFSAGCQIVTFSSGRGSLMGFASCPVIKLTSNPTTYKAMSGDIDINAGAIVSEGVSLDELGHKLIQYFLDVANGMQTVAERNGYGGPICFWRHLTPVIPPKN